MIIEELASTGLPPERFGEAGGLLKGSTVERLLGAVEHGFDGEEIEELKALLTWPGSYGAADPETVPYPPAMRDETRAELRKQAEGEGVGAQACLVLLYMNARARALGRFRSARHQA
jgi:hypothetical protein